MRNRRLLLVGVVLTLTASSIAGATTANSLSVVDETDRDCDGRYSSFDLRVSLTYSPNADLLSKSDPYVVLEYTTGDGWTEYGRVDDLPSSGMESTFSFQGGEFPQTNNGVLLRATAFDSDLTADDRLTSAMSERVYVEPDADDIALDPQIEWRTDTIYRDEQTTFIASDESDSECTIREYKWDLDGDGSYERQGRELKYSFDEDGYHTIELSVVNSRGSREDVSEEILVVFDPDGDGVTSSIERQRGLNPRDFDSDDDLFGDGVDPLPSALWFPTGAIHALLCVLLYSLFELNRG